MKTFTSEWVAGSDENVVLAIRPSNASAGDMEASEEIHHEDDAASSDVSDMSDDMLTSHAQIKSMIDAMDADDEPLVV